MKYFANYLPVEGEIEIGDMYFYKNSYPVKRLEKETVPKTEDYKKAQLFLCSRDIQVGDKDVHYIHSSGEEELIKEVKYEHQFAFIISLKEGVGKDLFKVIGPISPEATWVKEGDEFEEESIKRYTLLPPNHLTIYLQQNERLGYPTFLKIKGPCGHFH